LVPLSAQIPHPKKGCGITAAIGATPLTLLPLINPLLQNV